MDMLQEPNRIALFKRYMIRIIVILFCGYHFYTAGFGTLSALDHRLIHWISMFILIFLMYPGNSKISMFIDSLLVIMTISSGIHLLLSWREVSLTGIGAKSIIDIFLAMAALIVTLEGTRRTIGWVLPITSCLFLLYLFIGPWLPSSIGHHGYSLNRIATIIYFGTEGIFGIPIGVSSTMIIVFIIFGALLNSSGGGKFFIDLAFSIAGRMRGGSAKTAVVSSALMGTISGSPIANVVTTGTFTIPLMKKDGYKDYVAGAVEAIASTGGQIMPPVMGAAAFLMAEFIGVPYTQIALAALIPAIMYFISIYTIVDIEAIKTNIKGRPANELPSRVETLRQGWYLLLPLFTLIYFIYSGFSVTKSVYYSIILLIMVWVVQQKFNIKIIAKGLLEAAGEAVKSAAPVVSACACAGIIVGTIQLTGLGLRVSSLITVLSGGSLFIGLILCMISALILGMGLPTSVLYIVLATLAAPTLISMGTPVLSAHLFVFYFGCMSSITPPVALASYGAAGVAKCSAVKVGITAFKYSLVAYIIPYMMIYSPAMILMGTSWQIAIVFITSIVGTICLACAIQNWLFCMMNIIGRVLLFVSSLLFIKQGLQTDIIAFLILVGVMIYQYFRYRKFRASDEITL